jgi:aromatic-L-amino-acid/L-tryptophan decarboxylase
MAVSSRLPSNYPIVKHGTIIEDDFARVGRWIEEYLAHPEAHRVLSGVRPGEVAARLPERAPEEPESFERILDDFDRIIVPGMTHWNHPRFFAYFATSAAPAAIAAEALAATLDVKAMLWRTSPAATELEQVTMRWLGRLIGAPEGWTGIIYDTASIAGFTALATAREALDLGIREHGMTGRDLPRLRVYITEHTHSHVEKAAIALGIGQENVVRVPCDAEFRMLPAKLDELLAADVAAGHKPACVVATVGTTSITSVDPVPEIAKVARKHGVWLHVDAAYAGMAAMVPEYAHLLDGVAQADSLVVNPHKWMFVPMDLSVLFVKDEAMVRRAFSLVPEYLTTTDGDVVNYMDYGLQLGRRFRALKLWFVLRHLGARGIRDRLRGHIELAQIFASWVAAEPDWEVLAPHPLSVVCFRYAPKGRDPQSYDELNARLLDAVNATGELFISHTKIGGAYALRLAIGNLRTERSDVELAWRVLRDEAAKL